MFRVVTENQTTFAIEKVNEWPTEREARDWIGAAKKAERNANEYWIINTETGEIL